MVNTSNDEKIQVSVIASEKEDETAIKKTLEEKNASSCRFSVVIIVLGKKEIKSLFPKAEKGIIVYKTPVNIDLAKEVRDKLVEAGVSEIKDCFFDKDLNQVATFISEWNKCPLKEGEALNIEHYVKLPEAKDSKDSPNKLYASAMIGEMGELLLKLNKLANTFADYILRSYLQQENTDNSPFWKIKKSTASNEQGKVKPIQELKEKIQKALSAKTGRDLPSSENLPRLPKILLIGDSGVGKSLVANYIHETVINRLGKALDGEEKSRPARIGIPEFEKKEDDLEYSLFGYVPGAYTGANENGNPGLLLDNICQVVFLDEIGAATPSIQNKLLTYLDDYKVRPRGMNDDIFCPTLVVAATNERDKLNDPTRFRSDLLARFTDRLDIPNIKQRINGKDENLLYLLDCILQVEDINPEPKVESIDKVAFKALRDHFSNGCTGNFRELENLMREACGQARKDKRDYMVRQDVERAIEDLHLSLATSPLEAYYEMDIVIEDLHLSLATSPEESTQAPASTENAASDKLAPQTEMEPLPAQTEGIGDKKQEITDEDKEEFWKGCRILKDNDVVRKQVLEIILQDNTKGYSKIIKNLNLPEEDITKSFTSAVQRLSDAIRKHFHLLSCNKAKQQSQT